VPSMAGRRYANVCRNTTFSLTDCRHLDLNDSQVVELHRCDLPDSDWNSWASENVARPSLDSLLQVEIR
jgi:hypothetical protein